MTQKASAVASKEEEHRPGCHRPLARPWRGPGQTGGKRNIPRAEPAGRRTPRRLVGAEVLLSLRPRRRPMRPSPRRISLDLILRALLCHRNTGHRTLNAAVAIRSAPGPEVSPPMPLSCRIGLTVKAIGFLRRGRFQIAVPLFASCRISQSRHTCSCNAKLPSGRAVGFIFLSTGRRRIGGMRWRGSPDHQRPYSAFVFFQGPRSESGHRRRCCAFFPLVFPLLFHLPGLQARETLPLAGYAFGSLRWPT